MRNFLRCGLIIGLSVGILSSRVGADDAPAKPNAPAKPAADPKPAADAKSPTDAKAETPAGGTKPEGAGAPGPATANFDKLFVEWKDLLAKMRQVQERYQVASANARPALIKEFNALLEQGHEAAPKLAKAAENALDEDPANERIGAFLVSVENDNGHTDNYEEAYRLGRFLIEHGCKNPGVYSTTGVAAYCLNDYANAREYFKIAADANELSAAAKKYRDDMDSYEELWKKESQLREAEAKADDLPRIKITTTKGDIVVELFENEAPNTTANFISLVEKGFYDNTPFHRVLPGFMAQGGDPQGNGTGGPGYTIACECYRPDHRSHFRGTLSMAHAGRDTGGSQFFLTFVPTSNLNGRHTAFGRIVEGMDVLSKLQRIDPQNPKGEQPDRILKATVLRKRSHEYVPEKKSA